MWLVPIQVECKVESKTDQALRRMFVEDHWLDVTEVCDRWFEKGTDPEWPAADYLKVLASDRHAYLIKHDLECDEWFFVRRW